MRKKKEIVKEKAEQTKANKDKIKDNLPGLINEKGEIVDEKLEELKNLDENKGDVTEEIKKLKLHNTVLEEEVKKIKGEERLEELLEGLLAQIEVPTNKTN